MPTLEEIEAIKKTIGIVKKYHKDHCESYCRDYCDKYRCDVTITIDCLQDNLLKK